MSFPMSSPRLTPVPAVAAPVPVSPKKATPPPPATDLLLITSTTDFPDTVTLLQKEASAAGIRLDTILIEDLDGSNPGEKLTSLHRLMGESVASGKVQPATMIYVALHGQAKTDTDLDDYVDGQPHLQDFAHSLWKDDASPAAMAGNAAPSPPLQSATADGDSGTDHDSGIESDEEGFIHMMSACKDTLTFPSILLLEAIRHSTLTPHGFRPDFQGTIFIGSCEAGGMNEQLVVNGSDYVVLNGKKGGNASDADDCMLEVIGMMAERRQQQLPAFSGRDYWMRLRNVSGEHIAYVGQNNVEISKVLAVGCSEPVVASRSNQAAGQPLRILDAKLAHGSPDSLRAVFHQYGADLLPTLTAEDCFASLAMDIYRSPSELEEKIAILERHDLAIPDDPERMALIVEDVIRYANHSMLAILLSRRIDDQFPPALLQCARPCMFEKTEVAQKLQALCESSPDLRQRVTNWLQASIDATRGGNAAGRFDVSTTPYFGHLLLEKRLSDLPPPLNRVIDKYYTTATKPKLRSQVLNTLAWEDLPAVWDLAKYLLSKFKGPREEWNALTRLTPQIYSPKKSPQ